MMFVTYSINPNWLTTILQISGTLGENEADQK